ncbi:MAG: Gldg family protein [Verrucomicrobiota bacterium]|nr:Gldg family protein [Verrucomicrobiota bacterium]
MPTETPERPTFSPFRKWNVGLHVILAVIAFFAIVTMANYLSARHSTRFHLSEAASQKVSPLTAQMLSSLTNKVKVIVFFDRTEPLFPAVAGLIKEYQVRSPQIEVEFVDYRFPGRAEMIRSQYKLNSPSDAARVIFDSNGRVRTVLGSELSEYSMEKGKEIRRSSFKGEQLFTSAILGVIDPRQLTVYFTTGHGEHDPTSQDDNRGYGKLAKMLSENNVGLRLLPPFPTSEIPADCELLIIAGPEQPFTQPELQKLDTYLNQGGRVFILFNFFTPRSQRVGLERLLANWNVTVGFNQVRDTANAKAGEAQLLVANNFTPHPITKPLLQSSLNLFVPRSVAPKLSGPARADAPKIVPLVMTGPGGIAIGNIENNGTPEQEMEGEIPLIVAVEKGGIQGVNLDRGATRIVVAGNSLFLANAPIDMAANRDFANLAVNWLLNRETLLNEIPPRAISEYQITLTDAQMNQLRWLFLAAVPGSVMMVGVLVWFRRRA